MLMLLVTDPTNSMPDKAEAAFECIPERVFISERAGAARGRQHAARAVEARSRVGGLQPSDDDGFGVTLVEAVAAPVCSENDVLAVGEPVIGTLVLEHGNATRTLRVGNSALGRGILIGRYARCDLCLDNGAISRTHLMVVKHGDHVLAVDLASTLGSAKGSERFEVTPLASGETSTLADVARITWRTDPE
jgi:hypothetical protein